MYPDPVFCGRCLKSFSHLTVTCAQTTQYLTVNSFGVIPWKKNREIKAHPVCLFGLSTLRRNETRIFNPQKVRPGARLSKAPATFRARQATFSSPVYKNVEVYAPETSCRKRKPVAFQTRFVIGSANNRWRNETMPPALETIKLPDKRANQTTGLEEVQDYSVRSEPLFILDYVSKTIL